MGFRQDNKGSGILSFVLRTKDGLNLISFVPVCRFMLGFARHGLFTDRRNESDKSPGGALRGNKPGRAKQINGDIGTKVAEHQGSAAPGDDATPKYSQKQDIHNM